MYEDVPLPSAEILRRGDIYIGPPAYGPAVITEVNNKFFTFRDQVWDYQLNYKTLYANRAVFLRRSKDKLTVIAVGKWFENRVEKIKNRR
jgi:hypothetical protein